MITAESLRDLVGATVARFRIEPRLAFYTIDNPALDQDQPVFPAVVWRKPEERKSRNKDDGFNKVFVVDMLVHDSVKDNRSAEQSDRAHSRACAWADEIHEELVRKYERSGTQSFRNEELDLLIGDLVLTKRIDENTEMETGVRMLFTVTDRKQFCPQESFDA